MPTTIVTGSSRGLGHAIAVHLARAGHQVYATMRNPDQGAPLLAIAAAEGLWLRVLRLDVCDDVSVQHAVDEVLADAGRIDVLVNNAAVVHFSPIEHTGDDALRLVFETDLFGPLRVIRAALPTLRAQHSGVIVNVSSVGGRIAPFCTGPYVVAKHALEAASEVLAQEVAPFGIRVAVIEPGFFATRMLDDATATLGADADSPYADAERRICAWFAQNKQSAGDPVEVAQAVEHAITTTAPRLRYPVGDAPLYIEGRQRLADEDWVAMGRRMTDEEFFAEFATRFTPAPT